MKILLDTSFLLPFIQIEPDNITSKQLKEILGNAEHNFVYCDLSLFEMVAKGMKICLNSELTIEEIHQGIDSLVYRSPLQPQNWVSHPELLELAYKIRKMHSDLFDCLIFTTALYYTDCFATADSTLFQNIMKDTLLVKELNSINTRFSVWFDNLENPPVPLSKVLTPER